MYNFSLCSSFLNKFVVLAVTISLLFVSFSFSFEKNIKQELSNLCEATSVCACYNTITNFSYGIINKILESTKIVLTEENSQKNNNEKEEQKNDTQNNLYFVKSTNEKEINNLKNFNYFKFYLSDILLNKKICFVFVLSTVIFKFNLFKLNTVKTIFCYFARGNIDSINIINNIKRFRLV